VAEFSSFVALPGGNEVTGNAFSIGNLYAKEAQQFPPTAIIIWKFCITSDQIRYRAPATMTERGFQRERVQDFASGKAARHRSRASLASGRS
jgi:hypothetical protein